jgi:hypothetical protein
MTRLLHAGGTTINGEKSPLPQSSSLPPNATTTTKLQRVATLGGSGKRSMFGSSATLRRMIVAAA